MAPQKRTTARGLLGVARDDSDDELGIDDHPWEWLYASPSESRSESPSSTTERPGKGKRKRDDAALPSPPKIIGARMGKFECRLGDCVLLKADGSNEAWVAIIIDFLESDEDGDKAANFLWFSTEKEIRNRQRKRSDYTWVSCMLPLFLAKFSSSPLPSFHKSILTDPDHLDASYRMSSHTICRY